MYEQVGLTSQIVKIVMIIDSMMMMTTSERPVCYRRGSPRPTQSSFQSGNYSYD